MSDLVVAPFLPEHWDDVARIYGEGIATGNATFETDVPDWQAWDAAHLADHRLVALAEGGRLVGWTTLAPVSGRCVYMQGSRRTPSTSPRTLEAVVSGGRCSRS
jgi:L-amino acid N-acyltransferase YncA